MKKRFFCFTSVFAVAGALSAQEAAVDANDVEQILITGSRASLSSAQNIKQSATQIVDAIVADDIGKLPDNNLAEALQRVTGVQIQRSQGEGSGIQIRGFDEIRTEIDGRALYTAGNSRGLSFDDVPSELVESVEVYKTPSADQLEGAIGGIVKINTRRPFDFDEGVHFSARVQGEYGSIAKEIGPRLSAITASNWDTGNGKFGALLSVSYQKRDFGEDTIQNDEPGILTDVAGIPGDTVVFGRGRFTAAAVSSVPRRGTRERLGLNGVVQWAPSDQTEFYGEVVYTDFESKRNTTPIYPFSFDQFFSRMDPTEIELFPGTNVAAVNVTENVGVSIPTFINDRVAETLQIAGGGSWTSDKLDGSFDLSYTDSTNDLTFRQIALFVNDVTVRSDVSTYEFPSSTIEGLDLTDPANYTFNGLFDFAGSVEADLLSARADFDYDLGGDVFYSLEFGAYYSDNNLESQEGNRFIGSDADGNSLRTIPLEDFPGVADLLDIDNFFPAANGQPLIREYISLNVETVRFGVDALRTAFGLPEYDLPFQENAAFTLSEEIMAAYGKVNFTFDDGAVPISGNLGARVVSTSLSSSGSLLDESDGTFTPFTQDTDYTDVLPSLNVQADLSDEVILRLAASKVITRPSFDQLAPRLRLDFFFNTGSGGNINLQPLEADQLDLSVEWYFDQVGSLYAAGFIKNVDGFISNDRVDIVIEGTTFDVNVPVNRDKAKVKGYEVGYQQTFDFLPGPFNGLGMIANYTFVDVPSDFDTLVRFGGLSESSYNLIGFYEDERFSARLAYNWRDESLSSSLSNDAFQGIYSDAFGQLDASVSYKITDNLTFSAEMINVIGDPRSNSYRLNAGFDVPSSYTQDDRRALVGFSYKL